MNKEVTNPKHYTQHPNGIECIEVTEYMSLCLGNAIKYIWRADLKHDTPEQDLNKAIWYIIREMKRLGLKCEFDVREKPH